MWAIIDITDFYVSSERVADRMFRWGDVYTKCGAMLEGLHDAEQSQGDLFAAADPRGKDLLGAMDAINARFGRSAITIASAGHGARAHDT